MEWAGFRQKREQAHLGLSRLGDRLHREPLTRVVLYTTENDKSDRRTLFFYDFQDILFSKGELPFTGEHLDDGIFRVESIQLHLGSKSILVTCAVLNPRRDETAIDTGDLLGQTERHGPRRVAYTVREWACRMYSS